MEPDFLYVIVTGPDPSVEVTYVDGKVSTFTGDMVYFSQAAEIAQVRALNGRVHVVSGSLWIHDPGQSWQGEYRLASR